MINPIPAGYHVVQTTSGKTGVVDGSAWNEQHSCWWYRVLLDNDVVDWLTVPEDYIAILS